MEDSEIINLYFARDEQAISETQNKYQTYCEYISRNILSGRQDIGECVNEALLAVWNSIPPHRPKCLQTYIGKIVREISVSRLRRYGAEKRSAGEYAASLDELEEIDGGDDVQNEVEMKKLSEAINGFLSSLPQAERMVFIRRYWYCDPIKNIAKRFGLGESNVKMTLMRTRNKLKKYLLNRKLI